MSQAITLLGYRTPAIGLFIFSAIGLSEYRISDWRIPDYSDYRTSDQGYNLSDYRILNSHKTIGCPPLHISDQGLNLSDYRILDSWISVAHRVANFEQKNYFAEYATRRNKPLFGWNTACFAKQQSKAMPD
jgi:hypothetical protein